MKTLDLICDFCGESVHSLFCSWLDDEVSCYDCFVAKQLSEISAQKGLDKKRKRLLSNSRSYL